jgi:uncharacterized membrane protein (UPF0136 family)
MSVNGWRAVVVMFIPAVLYNWYAYLIHHKQNGYILLLLIVYSALLLFLLFRFYKARQKAKEQALLNDLIEKEGHSAPF